MSDEKITTPAPSSAESTALQSSSDHDLRVPCYCEENAWRLAYRHINTHNGNGDEIDWKYYVVFISNKHRCCPMFMQRASPKDNPTDYVCWDYHVIVMRSTLSSSLQKQHGETATAAISTQILDIDTWITPYPTPLAQYLNKTFPHALDPKFNKEYLPLFKVTRATDFIRDFYSDRMHMFKNGKWNSPPPDYPLIMNGLKIIIDSNDENKASSGSNLESYIGISSASDEKMCVFTLAQMYERSKDSNTKEWSQRN